METLRTQVRIARTRLVIEQVMGRLVGCLFVALIVTAVAIAIPKLVAIQGLPRAWDVGCLLGGLIAAITGTFVWTLLSRRTELDAAMEIDRRFGLKERVASSLQLSEREVESEAGTALVRDAVHRIERIEVNERFRVGLNRRSWLPLVPAAVAFALMVPWQLALPYHHFGSPVLFSALLGLAYSPLVIITTMLGTQLGNRLSQNHLRLAAYTVLVGVGVVSLIGPAFQH